MPSEMTSYINPKLDAMPRREKGGFGVFAFQPVHAGELLMVWGGRVLDEHGLEALPAIARRLSIQVEEGLYLVPIGPPEPADYVNHSCDPNAGMSGQIAVVAMRDIAAGEEVCIDYAMCDGSPYDEFECACRMPNCRKQITSNDWKKPELWERYAGYFSPYLQRRIDRLKEQASG
ncbi:MAG TPA: SET domain-containing protein [Anaerolineales bacterium]|nr:SET domain-containing protein [Anaerolineales bacterium]